MKFWDSKYVNNILTVSRRRPRWRRQRISITTRVQRIILNVLLLFGQSIVWMRCQNTQTNIHTYWYIHMYVRARQGVNVCVIGEWLRCKCHVQIVDDTYTNLLVQLFFSFCLFSHCYLQYIMLQLKWKW